MQLAAHLGAEVTGVCSAANLEWVKALGATSEPGDDLDEAYDAQETIARGKRGPPQGARRFAVMAGTRGTRAQGGRSEGGPENRH